MPILQKKFAENEMNRLGKAGRPFMFIIDFNQQYPMVAPLDRIDPDVIQYDFPSWRNVDCPGAVIGQKTNFRFGVKPIPYERYEAAFEKVQRHLQLGDSYLVNLTFPSFLHTDLSTADMFHLAEAPYRLWWRNRFVAFSPESFVRIRQGHIFSFPMKGTIDADIPEAEQLLLSNPKEKAEHATIVDLIRNDLSRVADRVRVKRFRYLEKIPTRRGAIWQSSSEIGGELPADYPEHIGTLLFRLLPAGSISGAPKAKTVEIIREAENYDRGYYTGVAGIFDGQHLDSAVLIRFVEEKPDGLYFKSGGGITVNSNAAEEYQELIRKADLPVRMSTEAIGQQSCLV